MHPLLLSGLREFVILGVSKMRLTKGKRQNKKKKCYTAMYHMVRCTNMLLPYFVYFTPLHTLYIFSDYNALNIQLGRVTETLAWWQRAIFFSPHSQQP